MMCRALERAGYDRSCFERLLLHQQAVMLRTQYRMHPAIASFPSQRYYESRLGNGVSEEQRSGGLRVVGPARLTLSSPSLLYHSYRFHPRYPHSPFFAILRSCRGPRTTCPSASSTSPARRSRPASVRRIQS